MQKKKLNHKAYEDCTQDFGLLNKPLHILLRRSTYGLSLLAKNFTNKLSEPIKKNILKLNKIKNQTVERTKTSSILTNRCLKPSTHRIARAELKKAEGEKIENVVSSRRHRQNGRGRFCSYFHTLPLVSSHPYFWPFLNFEYETVLTFELLIIFENTPLCKLLLADCGDFFLSSLTCGLFLICASEFWARFCKRAMDCTEVDAGLYLFSSCFFLLMLHP